MSKNLIGIVDAPTILVVDDEPLIRDMIARWLSASGFRVLQAGDAVQAWDCLEQNDVQLVTLDITMPGMSGIELLSKFKARFRDIPVLMLSASSETRTAIGAMEAGAFGYLIKPVQPSDLKVLVARGLEWRQHLIERRSYTKLLEQTVLEQTRAIRDAHEETIHRLVAAAMCRDEETGAHIVRTGLFSEVLARAAGWPKDEAELLRLAAPMHDIGKIGIADAILQKPGKLTEAEFAVMKTHTSIGAAMLAGSDSPILQLAESIALNHHEKWNGSGYPNGIAKDSIPVAARIVSIVDVYDALTHDRIYRPAFPEEVALQMMRDQQGSQFDGCLLAAFFSVLEEIREVARQNPDESAPITHTAPVIAPLADVSLDHTIWEPV